MIEHVPDPKGLVTEMARILKKGGRLVIQTPNSRALGRKLFGSKWYANDVPRHLILFCPSNLTTLAQRVGLRPAALKTSATPKILLNSWDYLIGKRKQPSRSNKFLRLLVQPYVVMATLLHRGDEIFAIYRKP